MSQEEIEAGRRATALHREVAGYFARLRDETVREWSVTQPSDTERRERLFLDLRALERLEGRIMRDISTGRLAEVESDA